MGHLFDIKSLQRDKFLNTHLVLLADLGCSLIASMFVLVLIQLVIPFVELPSHQMLLWLCFSALASVTAFIVARSYRAIIRYSTLRELGRLTMACIIKETIIYVLMALAAFRFKSGLLVGMVIMDFFITLGALLLIRVVMVTVYDRMLTRTKRISKVKHVLVYGISDKAVSMISRLRNSPHYSIAGFIAFGKEPKGHSLAGMNVRYFENSADVARIAQSLKVDGILFPYVADARAEQDRLIAYCREASLRTYVMPGIDEVSDGKLLANYVRAIRIEDLLGRPEIKISMEEIISNFNSKVVLVTGAAGSIGSELCRQLATFGIKRLVLLDNAETPLHNIRLELEDKFPRLDFVPVIGDVRSEARLDFVFRQYRPQIVFHAAAYKHVPLMEENPCEAVMVNVTGTRQVADKCVEYDVEKMVMVSTDKAVNPTNIMGCTKRLAEIYVQALGLAIENGEVKGRTRFVTTRFGNVLGSNGSVIPRFREQIAHGGPITVTHPEINRFFMTIPEACRLVMEAATFSTGTQIFVFNMGEPVKIVALARRMIQLAGLEEGRDIDIKFTGLRPGEKLYEEVLATKENTLPTSHERIHIAKVREYSEEFARTGVETLTRLASEVRIPAMVIEMKRIVPEFKSKNSVYEKYDHTEAPMNA